MTPLANHPFPPARAYRPSCAWLLAALFLSASTGCKVADLAPGDEEDDEKLTANGCGVERWSVKTGTDAAAAQVSMTPQDTTIAALRVLPVPSGLGAGSARFAGSGEMQVWRLSNVTLTQYKLEKDGDYHLVLKDSAGATMIVEIPAPKCVSGGPWAAQISAARAAMDAKFTVTSSFQAANLPITVVGAGFFDLLHGQTGVAPNAFELHATLSICFPGSAAGACSAATPDFGLSASPAIFTTAQGATGTSAISVSAAGGFAGAVALSAGALPAGASASFSPASVSGSGSSTLTLSAGSAAAGANSVTLTGTSGTITHTSVINWTITATNPNPNLVNGDFELGSLSGWTTSGAAGVVSAGAHGGTYAARLGSTSASGDSALSQTLALPAVSPQLSFWYQVFCPDTAVFDWASVTLRGASGAILAEPLANTCTSGAGWKQVTLDLTKLAGQTVTLELENHDDGLAGDPTYTLYDDVKITGGSSTTPDFSLAASPAAVSSATGGIAASTVTATAINGFGGTIALAASGFPSGATASFSHASLNGAGTSTLSLAAGSAAAGTYPITVAGTSGALMHSASVSWTIGSAPAPDFSLSLSAASVTSQGSATASDTVAIAPANGFSSAVALTVTGVPTGATFAFSPAGVSGGSGASTLTLTPGSATAGAHPLTVSASGGGLTHTQPLSWTIAGSSGGSLQTVFIILMENHNWSQIKGSHSAPYINNTLLVQGAHAENYVNIPGIHPSEPNYLFLEAGTNFGVLNDNPPSSNHQSTTQHLVTLLQSAGIAWKSYQEDISGTTCPLVNTGLYAPKHNPMVFFDDVTNSRNAQSANCIAHVRPYTELASDLTANTVPRYNFITPNLCNDMHNSTGCASADSIANGDTWLATAVPAIMASTAYKNGGVIFITWDESEQGDHPIGMMVMSPKAKRGYSNNLAYTHNSTLRTVETILGVSPFLGGAATAADLGDLFTSFP